MNQIGLGIATVGVWAGGAAISYFTKSTEPLGWCVGATCLIWLFGN